MCEWLFSRKKPLESGGLGYISSDSAVDRQVRSLILNGDSETRFLKLRVECACRRGKLFGDLQGIPVVAHRERTNSALEAKRRLLGVVWVNERRIQRVVDNACFAWMAPPRHAAGIMRITPTIQPQRGAVCAS
jgi:hypothetical protein